MTNRKILYKAVEEAEKYGYKYRWENHIYCGKSHKEIQFLHEEHPEIIIFSHEFCKAFWGEGKVYPSGVDFGICFGACREDMEDKWIYRWEFHLQQMVVAKESLKYIAQFLDK